MYISVLFLLNILIKYSDGSNEAHYECGPHGRFEYCIDGIPGCVVGCHCHPGYYFDTESKICEPNMKLAHDYRRHYALEPTRLPTIVTEAVFSPTPTTADPIKEKVDSITQDADDLGDWLYNQFFKTIENQVINKTDGEILTRRSGSQAAKPIPKRRSRKKSRKRSKSKRMSHRLKKKGLKQKLLRITEDDSLFDSSSNSDESSKSDSESNESDSDSDSDSDKDHGHRKILMFNKKPTALPSFIFLPNVETPFYPPIGLPPPPVLPMYPMVPVPPVGPYIGITLKCENDTTTSAPSTNESSSSSPTTSASSSAATEAPAPPADKPADESATDKVVRKHAQRNKMMRLRNKMKRMNKKPPVDQFANNFQDPGTPYFNEQDPVAPAQLRSQPDIYADNPPLEDVDFKYLSQLIHKMDLNKSTPNIPFNPGRFPPPNIPYQPRRSAYAKAPSGNLPASHKLNRPASKADEQNDSFYSSLGKQIATLIRKVDSNAEHEIDIEIEQEDAKTPMHTILNQNSYSPRSYWERFVRSPLKRNRNYMKEINNLTQSSETLFDLEDQVNVAAAVERTLSLPELENIANIMKITQSKPPRIRRIKISKAPIRGPSRVSNKRFDVNLLPLIRKQSNMKNEFKSNNKNFDIKNNLLKGKENERKIIKIHHSNLNSILKPRIDNEYNVTIRNISKNISKKDFLRRLLKSPLITPLHHQVSRIVHANVTFPKSSSAQHIIKYQVNPLMLNYKSFQYVTNNHNQYRPQHNIPFPIFSQRTFKSTGVKTRPSYYHHEFHHFDYFDSI